MLPAAGILALFLPGFVAMEIAFHLGPRNFRSNSEAYKYVIAILLGTVIYATTSLLSGDGLAASSHILTDPTTTSFPRIVGTLAVSVFYGWLWHMVFSHIVPSLYKKSRKMNDDGGFAVYHGPNKVFDQAMVQMDKLTAEIHLRDRKVMEGEILAYPDLDGDSGILLLVHKRGHLETADEFSKSNPTPQIPPSVVQLPPSALPFQPTPLPTEQIVWRPWQPKWNDVMPDNSPAECCVYIPGAMIEYVFATKWNAKPAAKPSAPPPAPAGAGTDPAGGQGAVKP